MQRARLDMMQQRVKQHMGTDSDLAARMARMRVLPSSISSASFPSSEPAPPPPPPTAPPQTVSMSSNPSTVPPPPRGPRILTSRDLDWMTPEQLNHEMRARGLQYDENVCKQQQIFLILRYDTDHRPGMTQPIIPKTSPPKTAAAATAIERRPVLQ